MFWGLILKANKKYTQTIEKPFHLTKACLDYSNADDNPIQVMYSDGSSATSYLLCTLQKGKELQCDLDLAFNEGDKLCFSTKGNGIVHLTGYLMPEDDFDNFDPEMDLDSENEEEEDSEQEVDEEEVEDLREKLLKKKKEKEKKKAKKAPVEEESSEDEESDAEVQNGDATLDSSAAAENDSDDEELEDEEMSDDDEEEDESDEDEEESDEDDEEEEVKMPPKKQQKLDPELQKKQKNGLENGQQQSKKDKQKDNQKPQQKEQQKPQQKEQQQQKERKLQGGLVVNDLKVGSGAEAKAGKKVQVYYEGRLKQNNKIFDSTKSGPGFKMTVGRGEVIKAWDLGLVGMKVGGKRRLTCPPGLAYGAKGNPPVIPPNSTLVFDIELKNVL